MRLSGVDVAAHGLGGGDQLREETVERGIHLRLVRAQRADRGRGRRAPGGAVQLARLDHLAQLAADLHHLFVDGAAVGLDLRLAGPADEAEAAAELKAKKEALAAAKAEAKAKKETSAAEAAAE